MAAGNDAVAGSRLRDHDLRDSVLAHARRVTATLHAGQTIGQALDAIRSGPKDDQDIFYFYVVDDDRRLVGVVPTRRLLVASPDTPLADVMVRNVIALPITADLMAACEFFVLYRLLAFPVVDGGGRLMGVVDISLFRDEMVDVTERQSFDDAFQMIGVHVDHVRAGNPWQGFRDRFPWLLCNVGGGIACALVASLHEDLLDAVIAVALFIPVVLALAESVSMQSMTITLQALHGQRVGFAFLLRRLRKELATAALLGCACGTLVGGVAQLWRGEIAVSLALGIAISASLVTASVLGVALPSAVRAVRGDPKVASGPVILATADIVTLLFYLHVARLLAG